jgi:hypothetical protein
MDRFEVIKHQANRWEVRGKICVDYQRWKLEDYSRVFTSKAEAQRQALKMDDLLSEAYDEHSEFQHWRFQNVKTYLASRASRPQQLQLSMF